MRRIPCLNPALVLLFTFGAVSASQAAPIDIPLEAVQAGTYYIQASLDGMVDTRLLLDTGSGYVSLSKATFDRIRNDSTTVFQRNITGVMANGHSMSVPVYLIGELKLSSHCILRGIEVAVFQNASRDILGINALKQMQPITLQLDPPVMTATCS